MKEYKKPVVLSNEKKGSQIIPIPGLSVGSAFAAGVAHALMKDDKNHLSRIPSIKKVQVV